MQTYHTYVHINTTYIIYNISFPSTSKIKSFHNNNLTSSGKLPQIGHFHIGTFENLAFARPHRLKECKGGDWIGGYGDVVSSFPGRAVLVVFSGGEGAISSCKLGGSR